MGVVEVSRGARATRPAQPTRHLPPAAGGAPERDFAAELDGIPRISLNGYMHVEGDGDGAIRVRFRSHRDGITQAPDEQTKRAIATLPTLRALARDAIEALDAERRDARELVAITRGLNGELYEERVRANALEAALRDTTEFMVAEFDENGLAPKDFNALRRAERALATHGRGGGDE